MQRRGAGGRFDYGGAVDPQFCGVCPMNEELERQAFEWWASDEGKYPRAVERRGDVYLLITTNTQWDAWMARAKQEIELPPVCDAHSDDTDKGYDICHYRVQEKLKQQGVPFKIEGADRWKK